MNGPKKGTHNFYALFGALCACELAAGRSSCAPQDGQPGVLRELGALLVERGCASPCFDIHLLIGPQALASRLSAALAAAGSRLNAMQIRPFSVQAQRIRPLLRVLTGWTMFLERKIIGRLEGKSAFFFGASQGATALADSVGPRITRACANNAEGPDRSSYCHICLRTAMCPLGIFPMRSPYENGSMDGIRVSGRVPLTTPCMWPPQVQSFGKDHPYTRLVRCKPS